MNHDEFAEHLVRQKSRRHSRWMFALYVLYVIGIIIASVQMYAGMPPHYNRFDIFFIAAVLIYIPLPIARLLFPPVRNLQPTEQQEHIPARYNGDPAEVQDLLDAQQRLTLKDQSESNWMRRLFESDEAGYGDDSAEKPKGKPKGKPKRHG